MTARLLRGFLLAIMMAMGPQAYALPVPGGLIADVALRDEADRTVTLPALVGPRPTVLVPVYFRCPNICTMSVAHLLDLVAQTGRAVEVVAVSFDGSEGPQDARIFAAQAARGHPEIKPETLHFLTGKPEDVDALMRGIGFTYRRDGGTFVHPALAAVVGADGRVAAWISTIAATDGTLTAALEAAAASRTRSFSDFVLTCVHAVAGDLGHDAAVLLALRIAGVLTVLALAGVVLFARKTGS